MPTLHKTYRLFFLLIFSLLLSNTAFSQSSKQKKLENRRKEILAEIRQINTLLDASKKEKTSLLNQVEELDLTVKATQRLIKITNEQANLLTREIRANTKKLKELEEELALLKEDYAKMVVRSYKSKKHDSKLMFILSSDNFVQAYKRLQYIKQYTDYRKKQGDSIKAKTEKLKVINQNLDRQKTDKEALIAENKRTRKKLLAEKQEQETLVANIKKDEGRYIVQIRKRQKERDRIEKQIDKIIRDAIAKSNKGKPSTPKSKTNFTLTKETKALASNFRANKGKLPWPVEKGIKTEGYGKKRHRTLANVTTFNRGVDIATEKGADARACFKGEVLRIEVSRDTNKRTIYLQHGNYITIYKNLSEAYVKTGDKVETKDPIGRVAKDLITGKTLLKFFIYQNTQRLNPEEWVYKM